MPGSIKAIFFYLICSVVANSAHGACFDIDQRMLFALKDKLRSSSNFEFRYLELNSQKSDQIYRTQDIVSHVMGWKSIDLVSFTAADLRYLPYVLPRSKLLLVANSEKALNRRRTERVIEVANFYGIEIYVLWLGDPAPRYLRNISQSTGGQLATKKEVLAIAACIS